VFTTNSHWAPHLKPFNNLTPYFSKMHSDIIFPCPLVYQVISCVFHTKPIYALITSSVHACCLDYLILPPLICLAMFGEECNLRSSPLSNFLRPSRTASVFSEFTFQRPSIFMFLPKDDKVSHSYKTSDKIVVLYGIFECLMFKV
jgi:hypothetical protein